MGDARCSPANTLVMRHQPALFVSYDPLEALVETQPGHSGKTQRIEEEKGDEERRPLVHCQIHTVATVHGQEDFAEAGPGAKSLVKPGENRELKSPEFLVVRVVG